MGNISGVLKKDDANCRLWRRKLPHGQAEGMQGRTAGKKAPAPSKENAELFPSEQKIKPKRTGREATEWKKRQKMEQQAKRRGWATAALFLTAVIWGGGFLVVKTSTDVFPPAYLLAIRFSLGCLALAVVFAKRLRKMDKALLWRGAPFGNFPVPGVLYPDCGHPGYHARKERFSDSDLLHSWCPFSMESRINPARRARRWRPLCWAWRALG